jgi:DNA-binding transcriptional regulator GbsR (MarR family)
MSSIERLIDQMGLIFQDRGEPRIAGRIFGLLLTEGDALSLQQISERLNVSRASVSTNARLLARRGAIRLTMRSGDRQDFYELNTTPYADIVAEMAKQALRQADTLRGFVAPIREESAGAARRVDDLAKALMQAGTMLGDWARANHKEQTIRKDQQ